MHTAVTRGEDRLGTHDTVAWKQAVMPGWPIRGFGLRSRYATLRYVEAA